MHIEFLGAAAEVTGSCHLLSVDGRRVLLDCGLIQGRARDEARNRDAFPFDPAGLDAVVLSHAHIDHSGRLPLLVKRGFRGPVYTHAASRDLARIMLRDAGYLQEREAEWQNRKRERKGLPAVEPLYTVADAEACLGQFVALGYGETRDLLPGVSARLLDAGHILGSSIVEMFLREGAREVKLVFSGDLGQAGAPILRDPTPVREADVVILESTYGDRLHRARDETLAELAEILRAAAGRGNVLIPAFAVGRSQELLYLLGSHFEDWNVGAWQVFLDSPMAIEATEVYARHSELYDREATARWRAHGERSLPNLRLTATPEESMAINRIASGALIIAASGMCTGGRIRHHLKHNVWRRDCHLIIVGFQARGTPGRALVDGARHLRLWGETVRVQARVHTIGGLSAHADRAGLCGWYAGFEGRPPVVLVHGEPDKQAALAQRLAQDHRAPVRIAQRGERLELAPAE